MSQADLRKTAGLALNTMTKLRRNEPVAMTVLEKICATLNVDFGDIIQYVRDESWLIPNKTNEWLKMQII